MVYTWIFQICVNFVEKPTPTKRQMFFTYLEDPGIMSFFLDFWHEVQHTWWKLTWLENDSLDWGRCISQHQKMENFPAIATVGGSEIPNNHRLDGAKTPRK